MDGQDRGDEGPIKEWEALRKQDLDSLLTSSRELSWSMHGKRLGFYVWGCSDWRAADGKNIVGGYPTVSITGDECALGCDHCRATLLPTMEPAQDPDVLMALAMRFKEEGREGMLISGGCSNDGTLPWERFGEAISAVKKETGLRISVHTGIVKESQAKALSEAGVDEALIDVIGSEATMREVYHIDTKDPLGDMELSLDHLADWGIPMVPHVLVGLHRGQVRGEMRALEMCARREPSVFVVIALIPQKGTPMEHVAPPRAEDVARFIAAARARMPKVPIALGCARPKPPYRGPMDRLAVAAGVNRIASPSREAEKEAKALGVNIYYKRTCCCVP